MNREDLWIQRDAAAWRTLFFSEEFTEQFTYDGKDLGCTWKEEQSVFKLWAPTAKGVWVRLYESGNAQAEDLLQEIPMHYVGKGVFEACLKGNHRNQYYTYRIDRNGEVVETQDPYSTGCGVNGKRSMIVDLSREKPTGFDEDKRVVIPEEERVIYELHMKDFSAAESSGIRKEYRGKYLAFTQDNTTLYGDGVHKTGISYLKELGITHVHLLPMFDFGSVEESGRTEQFNWGYDPVNYNVPEGSYATNAEDGTVRIRECRQMIQALHEAGIGVIMDVVYNHTYSLNSCFEKVCPYYYYRQNPDGTFSDGSACGNETASERIMFRRYMLQSVLHWAKAYHVDGFRFDLMGLHDIETMNRIREELDKLREEELGRKPTQAERILMYGEPWQAAHSPMMPDVVPAVKEHVAKLDEGIAVFCDLTRDFIKGSVFKAKVPGFANRIQRSNISEKERELFYKAVNGWVGCSEFSPKSQRQVINYVSAHDNYTLWDKLCLSTKKTIDYTRKYSDIVELNAFCAALYFMCQGIPFLQAGEEFGRTKKGIGDSYASPVEINCIDWERLWQYQELVSYYKEWIALRKKYQGFGSFTNNKIVYKQLQAEEHVLAYQLDFSDERLLFYINPMKDYVKCTPEEGMYEILSAGLYTARKGEVVRKTCKIPPRTVVILKKYNGR